MGTLFGVCKSTCLDVECPDPINVDGCRILDIGCPEVINVDRCRNIDAEGPDLMYVDVCRDDAWHFLNRV